jgi:hypothetical protein
MGGCVKSRRRIFIYGNSVILGSIGVSLQRSSQFEVTIVSPPLEQVLARNTEKPDILLFDLQNPHTEPIFSLLETNATLLLIGISPDTNLVKIWSGRELRDLSIQGLLELIKSELNGLAVESSIDKGLP